MPDAKKPQTLTLTALIDTLLQTPSNLDAGDFKLRARYKDDPDEAVQRTWAEGCLHAAAFTTHQERRATFVIEAVDTLRRLPLKLARDEIFQTLHSAREQMRLVAGERRPRLEVLVAYNTAYIFHAVGNFKQAAAAHRAVISAPGIAKGDRQHALYGAALEDLHDALANEPTKKIATATAYNTAAASLLESLGRGDDRWRINLGCWEMLFQFLVEGVGPDLDDIADLEHHAGGMTSPHRHKVACLNFLANAAKGNAVKLDYEELELSAAQDMEWTMLRLYFFMKFFPFGAPDTFERMRKLMEKYDGGHLAFALARQFMRA